ncbi:MAG: pyridoxamine 5'-phosphate oxidase family protein [Actinobacteria bacterium]|nr:pyridoxamine 5'-phosphate oxidase family protein [Actinomycetota bacterium]
MTHDTGDLEILTPAEALRLLGSVPVGRIVFTDKALPAVQPVNFVLDGRAVIIRAGEGSKLAAAIRNAVVAFQADQFESDYRRGWSVTAVGHAQEVLDPIERRRLGALPLRPWAPGDRDHFIRIPVELVHGRRIALPLAEPDDLTA